MKILVIGSEGNIGKKLVPYLRKKNHTVHRADIKQKYGDDYSVIDINCTNSGLIKVFNSFKPDVVYNLAAIVGRIVCEENPNLTTKTNLYGANNVIQLCKNFQSKLIYFSTSEVYGNIGGILHEGRKCKPNNFYGLSKLLGEEIVKYEITKGLQAVIVRPFMLYDENETKYGSVMISFAELLSKKKTIIVYRDSFRSWLHISDVIKIFEKLIYIDNFNIVNIAHPKVYSIRYLAQVMCKILGINYNEHIKEKKLLEKMTLTKYPDVKKQTLLTGVIPKVEIIEGIKKVLININKL